MTERPFEILRLLGVGVSRAFRAWQTLVALALLADPLFRTYLYFLGGKCMFYKSLVSP